jgi:hypothetical protein
MPSGRLAVVLELQQLAAALPLRRGGGPVTGTIQEALADLWSRWRADNPRGTRRQFVAMAEAATKPQQVALFDAPCPASRGVSAALGSDTDVWFADFWRTYPRKTGKRDARLAWAKAVRRSGDPAVVLAGARRYAADANLPEPQFVPHPATWLNGDRWEDGPLPARARPQPARRTRAIAGLAGSRLPALPQAAR